MRVFLTGVTGFIGKAVLHCLAVTGHDLRVLVRPDSQYWWPERAGQAIVGTLSDKWLAHKMAAFQPEVCIHCAWQGLPDYSEAACKRNYDLTTGLFDIHDWPRFVGVGTCFEYGKRSGCVAEADEAPESLGLFAAYKMALRLYGERLFRQRGREFLWVRPFFVYGPGQRSSSLLPSAYAALKAGRKPDVKTSDAVCDFVHVDDVAEGIVRLATGRAASGVYNLGTGVAWRNRDAVNQVAFALGMIEPLPAASDEPPKGIHADMTKLQDAIGWRPRIGIEEGIRKTVEAWEAGK
jgi:nucleoside-diphosphate-sugar epimerase